MATKIKPAGKFAIIILIGIVIALGVRMVPWKSISAKVAPQGSGQSVGGLFSGESNSECVRIGVVTWGGYIGGQWFNRGFQPNDNSEFKKQYGICVEFKLIDDFNASREAFKADQIDGLWMTADAFPTEAAGLAQYEPKILFQADWSRGGDAIIANRTIKTTSDLRGKKVAVAEGTPSHTLLSYVLEANGLSLNDIQVVKVPNAIDAAAAFKAGSVDAAVVWSPDDEDCLKNVQGARVVVSTQDAKYIIADGFIFKKKYIEANGDKLKKFVEGWFKGSAEINASDDVKKKASQILATGLNITPEAAYKAINKVHLTTYGDNLNFFGINNDYKGVTGEALYNKMTGVYTKLNLTGGAVPQWRSIVDIAFLQSISLDSKSADQIAEGVATFKAPDASAKTAAAITSKPVSISFESGSSTLSEDAKYIIDEKFIQEAKVFASNRIRIEGNTDNTGAKATNIKLSEARAKAVVGYLVNEHGFSANRFVVKGNGPDQPICNESTPDCLAKNRRTDFKLLGE